METLIMPRDADGVVRAKTPQAALASEPVRDEPAAQADSVFIRLFGLTIGSAEGWDEGGGAGDTFFYACRLNGIGRRIFPKAPTVPFDFNVDPYANSFVVQDAEKETPLTVNWFAVDQIHNEANYVNQQ